MQLNAQTLPRGTTLETDLCVVGAGPTGLSLAAEFANQRETVVVVESGSWDVDSTLQSLNSATVDGDPYAGLQDSRHRQVGGAARLWNTPHVSSTGAKYVPLDPIDFRGELGRPPWPIRRDELEPYYWRAQAVAGIGRFEYEAEAWQLPASPIPEDHPTLASRIYQFGPSDRFCDHLPRLVAGAPNLTLCSSATAVQLRWRGDTVLALDAVAPNANQVTVQFKRLVLAGGGVENARLLLVAAEAGHLRDLSGWLGRGFMEHPRDYSVTIDTTSRRMFRRLEFFDARDDRNTTICGRLALREKAIIDHDLPNASVTFLPLGRRMRPFPWRLESLAKRKFGLRLRWPPGYGWSRLPSFARRFDGFQLLINLEEFPSPSNRLTLESARDSFGVNRVRLHRRWNAADADRLRRLRGRLVRDLEEIGLKPLAVGPMVSPDPNSHHHLGTTRMGSDATAGVTDSFGQVFGSVNLFVVGGSLFPSAGYANPTLTSIALALRLADRLRLSS